MARVRKSGGQKNDKVTSVDKIKPEIGNLGVQSARRVLKTGPNAARKVGADTDKARNAAGESVLDSRQDAGTGVHDVAGNGRDITGQAAKQCAACRRNCTRVA